MYTDFEAIAKDWIRNKSPDIEKLEVGRANLFQRLDYADDLQRANINKAIWVLDIERSRILKTMDSESNLSSENKAILAK